MVENTNILPIQNEDLVLMMIKLKTGNHQLPSDPSIEHFALKEDHQLA